LLRIEFVEKIQHLSVQSKNSCPVMVADAAGARKRARYCSELMITHLFHKRSAVRG
jgi:hypothetical protein